MNPYSIPGNKYILIPLDFDTIDEINNLIAFDEIKKQSLFYNNLNVMVSMNNILKKIENYDETNKIYIISRQEDQSTAGLIGLQDIDWQQSRASLFLLMGHSAMKARECYEPTKLLLKYAIKTLHLRKIIIQVQKDNSIIETLLKGFGFIQEGAISNYGIFDGEEFDVVLFGLDKNKFRTVEDN